MSEHIFLMHRLDGAVPELLMVEGEQAYTVADVTLDGLLRAEQADDVLARLRAARRPLSHIDGQTGVRLGAQEVWAAGVTYKTSEEARERESNNSTIYTRVYSAPRPELFLKAFGSEVVTGGQAVGIRYDATWNVPEPELVIVLNRRLEVVGFTIGNDMSSRDIEGENPLYLPQAKMYERACAVGPRIWLTPGATTFPDVTIDLSIRRRGEVVYHNTTSTGRLHRTLSDLVGYLGRCRRFPNGVLLFTGTGIVPPDTFTLAADDDVTIAVEPIGTLTNPVTVIRGIHDSV